MAAQAGSPTGTVAVVKKLVGGGEAVAPAPDAAPVAAEEQKLEANGINGTNGTTEDIAQADTAAEVADTAEKLDSNEAKPEAV